MKKVVLKLEEAWLKWGDLTQSYTYPFPKEKSCLAETRSFKLKLYM